MKKLINYVVVLGASAMLFTGCALKYSGAVSPVTINDTNMKEVENMKNGESCQKNFLFIPLGFSATALEAAKDGDISKIEYQEVSRFVFFTPFIYSSHCLKVYGK